MAEYRLGAVEMRFAELIWSRAPIPSGELVKLCEQVLDWKKSTTYTMLKRLCQRGLFQNQDGTVTARISREEFAARQSEEFLEESFSGSLPQFLAAFTRQKKLSEQEIAALQQLIDENRRQS